MLIVSLQGPELLSKYVGESERALREVRDGRHKITITDHHVDLNLCDFFFHEMQKEIKWIILVALFLYNGDVFQLQYKLNSVNSICDIMLIYTENNFSQK